MRKRFGCAVHTCQARRECSYDAYPVPTSGSRPLALHRLEGSQACVTSVGGANVSTERLCLFH